MNEQKIIALCKRVIERDRLSIRRNKKKEKIRFSCLTKNYDMLKINTNKLNKKKFGVIAFIIVTYAALAYVGFESDIDVIIAAVIIAVSTSMRMKWTIEVLEAEKDNWVSIEEKYPTPFAPVCCYNENTVAPEFIVSYWDGDRKTFYDYNGLPMNISHWQYVDIPDYLKPQYEFNSNDLKL
jgi:hypothetical protein